MDVQYSLSIIVVDEPFRFNEFVQPVCLPTYPTAEPANGTVTLVSKFYKDLNEDKYEMVDGELLPVRVSGLTYRPTPIASREECLNAFGKPLSDDQLCVSTHGSVFPDGGYFGP